MRPNGSGTPRSTGVYYDDSYDRRLYPPGSNCQGNPGTECTYFEIAEADFTKLFSPLNPDNLPHAKDAQGHCLPVYPHDFIKVNTVFEVIRGAGGHTAWSDKHPAYDLVNGPSGTGVEDLYTPEINSPIANGGTRQWRQPEGDARPVRRDDQLAAAEQGRRLHHLRARGHGL